MKRAIAFYTVLAVTALFRGPSGQHLLLAQDASGGISASIAFLDTRVTWARGCPFFPANDARYYAGRYDTPTGPVEVFLVEPEIRGIPPFGSGSPPPAPCGQVELAVYGTIVEAFSPTPDYRVFFRASAEESEVERAPAGQTALGDPTISSGEAADLCAFSAAFIEAFELFRAAAADRGRPLSFSGGGRPEFPAVIDVAR